MKFSECNGTRLSLKASFHFQVLEKNIKPLIAHQLVLSLLPKANKPHNYPQKPQQSICSWTSLLAKIQKTWKKGFKKWCAGAKTSPILKIQVIYFLTFFFSPYSLSEQVWLPTGSCTFKRTPQDGANSEVKELSDTHTFFFHYSFYELLIVIIIPRSLKRYVLYLRYSLSLVSLSIYILISILPCDILRPGGKLHWCSVSPEADTA